MLSRAQIKHRIMQLQREDLDPQLLKTPYIAWSISGKCESTAAPMSEVWPALVEMAREGRMRLVVDHWEFVEEEVSSGT